MLASNKQRRERRKDGAHRQRTRAAATATAGAVARTGEVVPRLREGRAVARRQNLLLYAHPKPCGLKVLYLSESGLFAVFVSAFKLPRTV